MIPGPKAFNKRRYVMKTFTLYEVRNGSGKDPVITSHEYIIGVINSNSHEDAVKVKNRRFETDLRSGLISCPEGTIYNIKEQPSYSCR